RLHHPPAGGDGPGGGRQRGASAGLLAAVPLALLLRDGHLGPFDPDRSEDGGRRDPAASRGRLARLSVAARPARGHRGRRFLHGLPDRRIPHVDPRPGLEVRARRHPVSMDYRAAGVDLDAADAHVDRIAPLVTATWGEEVVGGFGGFAAGVRIPPGYTSPVLMMCTDGVGTKLELARRSGRWDGVGQDLVARSVDDLGGAGARPPAFVDYGAGGSLRAERDGTIVASVAAACARAGCGLVGGETAEHPGVMDPEAVDLAGAAVGVVEDGEE